MRASDTCNHLELDLLHGVDGTLVQDLKDANFVDMLRFGDLARGDRSGFAGLLKDTHLEQYTTQVNDFVRRAQAAFLASRPLSIVAVVVPMSEGELLEGHSVEDKEKTLVSLKIPADEVAMHGLAVRVSLARAKEGDFYNWMVHYPLYGLLTLSHPPSKGTVKANSEHTNSVAKQRRAFGVVDVVSEFDGSPKAPDKKFALAIKNAYNDHAAPVIKAAARQAESYAKKAGFGSKFCKGRMLESGSKRWDKQVACVKEIAPRNTIEPIMNMLSDEEVDMCAWMSSCSHHG